MPKPDDTEENKVPTNASDIQQVVETANAEDEDLNDDEVVEEDDASEEEDSGDKDSKKSTDKPDDKPEGEEEAESDDDKPESTRRFTQFAGDGSDEQYITNLEKAYNETSAEGIRLNKELGETTRRVNNLVRAMDADPELADKVSKIMKGSSDDDKGGKSPESRDSDTTDLDNPFLVDAQTKWQQQSQEEVKQFIDANPEVLSDPELKAEVLDLMETFSQRHYRKTKTLMPAGEAMRKAYQYLGREDKSQKAKGANDLKKAVTPTRPQGARKKGTSDVDLSPTAVRFGGLMGVSEETLKKYAKK